MNTLPSLRGMTSWLAKTHINSVQLDIKLVCIYYTGGNKEDNFFTFKHHLAHETCFHVCFNKKRYGPSKVRPLISLSILYCRNSLLRRNITHYVELLFKIMCYFMNVVWWYVRLFKNIWKKIHVTLCSFSVWSYHGNQTAKTSKVFLSKSTVFLSKIIWQR